MYYRSRSGPLQTKIVTVTSDGVILHQWGLTPPSSLANRTLQTYHHPTEPVHSCWLQEAGVAWAHSRLSVLSKHWSCKLSAASTLQCSTETVEKWKTETVAHHPGFVRSYHLQSTNISHQYLKRQNYCTAQFIAWLHLSEKKLQNSYVPLCISGFMLSPQKVLLHSVGWLAGIQQHSMFCCQVPAHTVFIFAICHKSCKANGYNKPCHWCNKGNRSHG